MDVILPGLRDRRIAASDEYLDGNERRERRLFNDRRSRTSTALPLDRPYTGRFIYGLGSQPRRESHRRPLGFDVRRIPFSRNPGQITTIVLHSTAGPAFEAVDLPPPGMDTDLGSYHRVDEIIANFVVFRDGTIVYTHDVEFILSVAGGGKGIDIEFAGEFPNDTVPPSARRLRLDRRAILEGRRLISRLKGVLRHLSYIHPHGQVQRGVTPTNTKFDSCPGPDVWVNVGQWAVNNLGLTCDRTDGGYPNHGISRRQSNPAYEQTL